jgi:hypothetical protein
MINNAEFNCRVCGMEQEDYPWGLNGRTPSFEICACCGVEFGYGDCTQISVARWRENWIEKGASWHDPTDMPTGWSLEDQLRRVPEEFFPTKF